MNHEQEWFFDKQKNWPVAINFGPGQTVRTAQADLSRYYLQMY